MAARAAHPALEGLGGGAFAGLLSSLRTNFVRSTDLLARDKSLQDVPVTRTSTLRCVGDVLAVFDEIHELLCKRLFV